MSDSQMPDHSAVETAVESLRAMARGPKGNRADYVGTLSTSDATLLVELLDRLMPTSGTAVKTASEWRCFHCDDVFTDEAAAREHFGYHSGLDDPGCVIALNQGEKLLLAAIRDLEARNKELLLRAHRAEAESECYAGLRAELQRYFGASDAWTCWNRMDEKQGRIEALELEITTLRQASFPSVGARARNDRGDEGQIIHLDGVFATLLDGRGVRIVTPQRRLTLLPVAATGRVEETPND